MNWLKKNKKIIFRLLLLLFSIIFLSLLVFLIFYLTGIIEFNDGFSFNIELFDGIKGYWRSYLVFLLLQIIFTTLLCFAPGGSMAFILLGVALFGASWETFLLCFSGVILSSILMDILGRFGGTKVIIKLIGEDDYNKALKILTEKGSVYLPVCYILPVFPDDALCMIAGMIKIKFWLHLLYIVLCRGIGVATIVFGISIIPFNTFTTLWDWLVCGAVLLVYICLILFIARKIDLFLSKRLKNKQNKEDK